jgi:hypothetical protein
MKWDPSRSGGAGGPLVHATLAPREKLRVPNALDQVIGHPLDDALRRRRICKHIGTMTSPRYTHAAY